MTDVVANLSKVRLRVERAAQRVGRDPATIRLVAVSKVHAVEKIREAYAAGQRLFGENYAQELASKAMALRDLPGIEWHFIGRLQRNKVKLVMPSRADIQCVDSLKLLERVARDSEHKEICTRVWIQVNTGRESQKSGCDPKDVEALVSYAQGYESLACVGLMAIPPWSTKPEDARPHFAMLRALAERVSLSELSMGMSTDLEVAIEEGATVVRVGTAIFGPRPAKRAD